MKNNIKNRKDEIIKHINKLQGQLNAVKFELEKENRDCDKASNTLFAASRSFASLRALFIKNFLDRDFLKNSINEDKLAVLLTLIKG